jgi:hypothetical protein
VYASVVMVEGCTTMRCREGVAPRGSELTMARVSSSWSANTSAIFLSYESDQSWYPSDELTSCAETRTRSPARLTLPSSTAPTLSRCPTSRASTSFPLNVNADPRETTRRPSTRPSAVISSSVMPSLKYSFSGSALTLTNGSTTIVVRRAAAGSAGASVPCDSLCSRSVRRPASSPAEAIRSAGWRARRRSSRSSSAVGADTPAALKLGAGSVSRRTICAMDEITVNGGCPASISYRTQPSE